MATMPATILVILLGIAAMAMTVSEAKMKKRSVDLPMDANLKSADTMMVRRVSGLSAKEPELFRTKRFKRDLQEPALQGVKRIKRARADKGFTPDKRIKRDVDEQLEMTLEGMKQIDDTKLSELSRQKRFKRAITANTLGDKDMLRLKRASKTKKLALSMEPYVLPTIKRSKRGGLTKVMDSKKHTHSHFHLREKRRQPMELSHVNKMGEMVKKAVEKLKRSKRRPKHSVAKLHRAKRGSSKDKRSDVLKDITRDITRLQRLRTGIAHEVIRDSKRQTRAKNHSIVKRNDSPKNHRNPIKKHHN